MSKRMVVDFFVPLPGGRPRRATASRALAAGTTRRPMRHTPRRLDRIGDVIYDIEMLRLVIDTDVIVAALQSDSGASRQLLLDVLDRHCALLLSVPLMLEYEAVLTRPGHLLAAGIDERDVRLVLDELAGLCVPVAFDYRWRPTGADGDDELVVETAVNGLADVVATFNTRHMQKACERFGISAERPVHCLRRIRT
nr:PIN domain-containing protein [Luteimonas padinae]